MPLALSVCTLLSLAACMASREPQAPASEAGACDAAKADHYIGENLSGYLQRQAQADSGAADVRVLRPDDAATLDINPRRLNIHVDPGQVIIKLSCG